MTDAVLVLNAGSSSIKVSVFAVGDGAPALHLDGQISGIGSRPHFVVEDADGNTLEDAEWESGGGHAAALERLLGWFSGRPSADALVAVGHRVVHGGPDFSAPVVIDRGIVAKLEEFVPLAPLHQPHNLAPIRTIAEQRPDLPQVACFDTAFHRGHPEVADRYALPPEYYDRGIRRYGFHGLSYEYIARSLPQSAPELADGRVVVAHLGNGASMCAIRAGRSVETTMGFTAVDGLPMGTRCGSLDPGAVLHFVQQLGMGTAQVEELLYKKSGLLGVSGISNDMRELLASDDPRAHLAVAMFVYRINQELGRLAASLGGLDGLVFTAGIGENAAAIRARVCEGARWLGIDLDAAANEAGGPRLTTPDSRVSAWVVPTDEERMIALHTLAAIGRPAPE
jgi:acetate kinase